MNPLLKRLASLRFKVRLLDGWQGICAVAGLIVGVGVTVGILDYTLHLPNLFRAAALVGLLVGSGCVAFYYLLRSPSPSRARRSQLGPARIEDAACLLPRMLLNDAAQRARSNSSSSRRKMRPVSAARRACAIAPSRRRWTRPRSAISRAFSQSAASGLVDSALAACCILLAGGMVAARKFHQNAQTAFLAVRRAVRTAHLDPRECAAPGPAGNARR